MYIHSIYSLKYINQNVHTYVLYKKNIQIYIQIFYKSFIFLLIRPKKISLQRYI